MGCNSEVPALPPALMPLARTLPWRGRVAAAGGGVG
jgi:hypothetical protein